MVRFLSNAPLIDWFVIVPLWMTQALMSLSPPGPFIRLGSGVPAQTAPAACDTVPSLGGSLMAEPSAVCVS